MDPNGRSPRRPTVPRGREGTGGAPSDGDFARLLEQASSPRAHRLGGGEAAGEGTAPDHGPTGDAAPPSPGEVRGGRAAPPDEPVGEGFQPVAGPRRPAPRGGPPKPVRRDASRTLRDRIAPVLVGLALVVIAIGALGDFADAGRDSLGGLAALGIVLFIVLRGLLGGRSRRPPP
ncbi:MAG TPA: hypothetical protein VEA81_15480 [Burkholderiaceae bacterium]|nr:hypothetical protein [Burkholderiaceae bacterium]